MSCLQQTTECSWARRTGGDSQARSVRDSAYADVHSCLASSPYLGRGHSVWMTDDGQQASVSPFIVRPRRSRAWPCARPPPGTLALSCACAGPRLWTPTLHPPEPTSVGGAMSLSFGGEKSGEGWNFHVAQKVRLPNHPQ